MFKTNKSLATTKDKDTSHKAKSFVAETIYIVSNELDINKLFKK